MPSPFRIKKRRMVSIFHTPFAIIKSIKPLQGYLLHVIFDDGKDCIYDVNDDINTIQEYEDLKNILRLSQSYAHYSFSLSAYCPSIHFGAVTAHNP